MMSCVQTKEEKTEVKDRDTCVETREKIYR